MLKLSMKSDRKILIKFGERIKVLRKEKGLSQEELAHKAGFHRTYIGMVERAERNITLVNMEKLANSLEVSINDLFNFDNGK